MWLRLCVMCLLLLMYVLWLVLFFVRFMVIDVCMGCICFVWYGVVIVLVLISL